MRWVGANLFGDRIAVLRVPGWSLGAGEASYWGRRWWVHVGPIIVTWGKPRAGER